MAISEVSQVQSPVAALAVTNPLFQFKLQYSRDEAAAILGFSLRTVDRLIAENQLHVRRTGRRVLITRVELEQFTKRDHPTGGVQ